MNWAGQAIPAGTNLVRRCLAIFDAHSAAEWADRIFLLPAQDALVEKGVDLAAFCDAAFVWNGPRPYFRDALLVLVGARHSSSAPKGNVGERRELAVALGRVGRIVEVLDGSSAARLLHEEEQRIIRALAEDQPTPVVRYALAIALGRLHYHRGRHA